MADKLIFFSDSFQDRTGDHLWQADVIIAYIYFRNVHFICFRQNVESANLVLWPGAKNVAKPVVEVLTPHLHSFQNSCRKKERHLLKRDFSAAYASKIKNIFNFLLVTSGAFCYKLKRNFYSAQRERREMKASFAETRNNNQPLGIAYNICHILHKTCFKTSLLQVLDYIV